jgi:hypothetical protein
MSHEKHSIAQRDRFEGSALSDWARTAFRVQHRLDAGLGERLGHKLSNVGFPRSVVLEIVGLRGESIVVVVHFMFATATDSNLLGLPVSGEEDDGFRLVLGLEVENRGHTGSQTLDNMFMARVVE